MPISTSDGRKPSGSVMAALLPLATGYFLSSFIRNMNGLVAKDIRHDLLLGADTLGLLIGVYSLVFAAVQVPVGQWLDRYGPRRVHFALLCCGAAGLACCAMALDPALLLVGQTMIGFGTAGCLMSGLKAATQLFPRERLATINGAYIACNGLGALAATIPAERLLQWLDWRGLMAVLSAAVAAVAAWVWRCAPGRQQAAPDPGSISLRDIIRDPMFRRFAPVSASCYGTVLAVQSLWAGSWLIDVEGLSRRDAATDLACMAATLVVAAPAWGLLTRKLRPFMPLTSLAGGAICALILVEVMLVARVGLPPVLLWCLFALFGGMQAMSFSAMADHFPPAVIGRANGTLNVAHITCTFVIQAGLGQVIALWPQSDGHYPAHAYQAGLLLPLAVQTLALINFVAKFPAKAAASATG